MTNNHIKKALAEAEKILVIVEWMIKTQKNCCSGENSGVLWHLIVLEILWECFDNALTKILKIIWWNYLKNRILKISLVNNPIEMNFYFISVWILLKTSQKFLWRHKPKKKIPSQISEKIQALQRAVLDTQKFNSRKVFFCKNSPFLSQQKINKFSLSLKSAQFPSFSIIKCS